MNRRSIFIATPAYGGQVAIQYTASLLGTCVNLISNGVECISSLVHGGPYVDSERNHAVRRFLDTDCTHLLFIDADLEFQHDAALKMLNRDKDIIGGLYPFKSDSGGFPVRPISNEVTELMQVEGLPTGFMLIKRSVIEAMIEHYQDLKYIEEDKTCYGLFMNILKDGTYWSEDYIFCRRWLDMGGELWAETDLTFSHFGGKAWKGNYFQEYKA